MEQFFSENPYALYFIGLLFLIVSNRSNKNDEINKNIILIYIIFSLVSIFHIIEFKYNVVVVLLICFIELQVLNLSSQTLIVKTKYKLYDYIFIMISKYKFINILLLNFIFQMIIPNIFIWKLIKFAIYFILLIYIITRIYRNTFKLRKFEEVEDIFNNNAITFNYLDAWNGDLNTKLKMLVDIEDKTFLFRRRTHNSLSLEALIYKINKENGNKEIKSLMDYSIRYLVTNIKGIFKYGVKIITTVIKAIFCKNGIIRYIKRGYSTIEMQWIRNVGIERGYEKIYRRKLFEVIYSNIFFKSLEDKRNYNIYPEYDYNHSKEMFKLLILYVYLKTVPTFIYINGTRVKCHDIFEFYYYIRQKSCEDENVIEELSKEELFIFIMGLSAKVIDENLFYIYKDYILKYNIDTDEVINICRKINQPCG